MIVSYNWLKKYLGEQMPSPEQIGELLNAHIFEVEGIEAVGDDFAIDVDVLPNRGSDCLSHRGVAKEIAAITGVELIEDPFAVEPNLEATDLIKVAIEDTERCDRFTATLIKGIEVKESPQWLKDALLTLGQRPINNIVDATNYVMYATGQPLHAYDATKFPQVDGAWQFGVRLAKEGEVVSLLAEGGSDEDRDVELTGSELLIVDASSDTPIGLAGVKGGRFAGVDADSTDIIVEAAHFDAATTRATARRLGIVIDASKRFENNPSANLPLYGQAEIIKLITEIAGGQAAGTVDVYPNPQVQPEVQVCTDRVNALLGLTLSTTEMMNIVSRLGVEATETPDGFTATAPMERTDLLTEVDYIEEIGRIHGYEHVTSVVPEPIALSEVNARQFYADALRQVLTAAGFNEVITSSFRKKDKLKLANALASDKGYMRSNLRKNLTTVLEQNVSHTDLIGAADVRVFEIGTVFNYDKETKDITQHTSLAIGVQTKHSGYTPKDDKKLEEGLAAAREVLGDAAAFDIEKGIAECNLTDIIANLPKPEAYAVTEKSADVTYVPFSSYPAMSRDISMWMDESVTAAAVEEVLNSSAGKLRVKTTLFDEFAKDGQKSLAFRLVFQSHERTLTDDEVHTEMEKVNAAVAQQGWTIR